MFMMLGQNQWATKEHLHRGWWQARWCLFRLWQNCYFHNLRWLAKFVRKRCFFSLLSACLYIVLFPNFAWNCSLQLQKTPNAFYRSPYSTLPTSKVDPLLQKCQFVINATHFLANIYLNKAFLTVTITQSILYFFWL